MKTDKQMIDELYDDVQKFDERKKKKSRIRFSVICAVVLMMALTLFANGERIRNAIMSPEWFEEFKASVNDADGAEQIEPFKAKIEKSDDPFVKQALSEGAYINLFEDDEKVIDQTVSNGGYDFHFEKIVGGEKLINKCVSGNPITGTGKFEWTKEKAYFALFDISRSDGMPLTEADYEYYPAWAMYADGYTPYKFIYTLLGSGYVFQLIEEYDFRYAVEITNLAAFAGRKLTIAPVKAEIVAEGDIFDLDAEGRLTIQNSALEAPHALFSFTLDESYADKDFVRQFEAEDPNRILKK